MALFRQPTARTALPGDAVETVSPDAPTLAPVGPRLHVPNDSLLIGDGLPFLDPAARSGASLNRIRVGRCRQHAHSDESGH